MAVLSGDSSLHLLGPIRLVEHAPACPVLPFVDFHNRKFTKRPCTVHTPVTEAA